MIGNSIKRKTLITIYKTITTSNDINQDRYIQQIENYIALTPLYVKMVFLFCIVYCNVVSLFLNRKMLYSLSNEQAVLVLRSFEKSFAGHSIIMMLKLLCTLVHFDDDAHARSIGYIHLEHCK